MNLSNVDTTENYIDNLKSRTSSVIGYSGHERGWHIPLAAFTKGAQVIEKHFTLDKSLEGNDHKVSLLPDCVYKCTAGVQPPARPKQSHEIEILLPVTDVPSFESFIIDTSLNLL